MSEIRESTQRGSFFTGKPSSERCRYFSFLPLKVLKCSTKVITKCYFSVNSYMFKVNYVATKRQQSLLFLCIPGGLR